MLDAVNCIREKLGSVDLMIANAGVSAPTLVNPPNTEQIERMLHVNLFGVIYSIEAVLPEMLAEEAGTSPLFRVSRLTKAYRASRHTVPARPP